MREEKEMGGVREEEERWEGEGGERDGRVREEKEMGGVKEEEERWEGEGGERDGRSEGGGREMGG